MRNIFKVFAIGVLMTGTIVLTGCGKENVDKAVNKSIDYATVTTEATTEATTKATETTTTITTTSTSSTSTTTETTTTTNSTTTSTKAATPIIETVITTEIVEAPVTEFSTTATTARDVIEIATTTTVKTEEYYPTAEEVATALASMANDCLNYKIVGATNYPTNNGNRKGTIVNIKCNDRENENLTVSICLDLVVKTNAENRTFSIDKICTYRSGEEKDEVLAIFPMALC